MESCRASTSTQSAPIRLKLWGFWGGRFSQEDASPAHCASRELREELDLAARPTDFTCVSVRPSSNGEAWLMLYQPAVEGSQFRVCEGAGAGFFFRRKLLQLSLSKPVAHHLRMAPELFVDQVEPGGHE
jgi:ADP-ribose pyrophosphatase YjhB (NUDIX family)